MVASGRTIPFGWDGTLGNLPPRIDAVGFVGVDDPGQPTSVSALAAEVAPDHQGIGLSGLLVLDMAAVAQDAGLAPLVAPIRPSWRVRYPPIAIDRYATRTASTQLMPPIRWLPGQTEPVATGAIVSGSRWRPGRL